MCKKFGSHSKLSAQQVGFIKDLVPIGGRLSKEWAEATAREFEKEFPNVKIADPMLMVRAVEGERKKKRRIFGPKHRGKKPGSPHKPTHRMKRAIRTCVH